MERECKKPDDCRITQTARVSTCAYYPPVYDGHGKNTNPDMNLTTWTENCSTCGKSWSISSRGGVETRELIDEAA